MRWYDGPGSARILDPLEFLSTNYWGTCHISRVHMTRLDPRSTHTLWIGLDGKIKGCGAKVMIGFLLKNGHSFLIPTPEVKYTPSGLVLARTRISLLTICAAHQYFCFSPRAIREQIIIRPFIRRWKLFIEQERYSKRTMVFGSGCLPASSALLTRAPQKAYSTGCLEPWGRS